LQFSCGSSPHPATRASETPALSIYLASYLSIDLSIYLNIYINNHIYTCIERSYRRVGVQDLRNLLVVVVRIRPFRRWSIRGLSIYLYIHLYLYMYTTISVHILPSCLRPALMQSSCGSSPHPATLASAISIYVYAYPYVYTTISIYAWREKSPLCLHRARWRSSCGSSPRQATRASETPALSIYLSSYLSIYMYIYNYICIERETDRSTSCELKALAQSHFCIRQYRATRRIRN